MNLEQENKNYNQYMMDLYRDCSIEIYKMKMFSNQSSSVRLNQINIMFEDLSSEYNNNIASGYLLKLDELNKGIESKVKNYPSMYWKTPQGKQDAKNGLKQFSASSLETLFMAFYKSKQMDTSDKETVTKYIEKTFEIIKELSIENYFDAYIQNITHVFADIIQTQSNDKTKLIEITSLKEDKLSLEIINGLSDIYIKEKDQKHLLKDLIKDAVINIYSINNKRKQQELKHKY